MINKLKRIVRKLAIVACIVIVASMGLKIAMTRDYRGGGSYVSYSPDGKYKMDRIYLNDSEIMMLSLTDLEKQQVVLIDNIPIDWPHIQEHWEYNKKRTRCIYYNYGDEFDKLPLPPSIWDRLHAWLTIKLKDLENPKLKIVEISTRYSPVTKK
ncbi:hypothetical protein [Halodesulfovibrio aestuarii]|uniref:Uncharacterized protein n=1 Tax=Halodesulfovibrio aestuarii TaxID=126333 RepID=A0ABV4JQQ4_9BACT